MHLDGEWGRNCPDSFVNFKKSYVRVAAGSVVAWSTLKEIHASFSDFADRCA